MVCLWDRRPLGSLWAIYRKIQQFTDSCSYHGKQIPIFAIALRKRLLFTNEARLQIKIEVGFLSQASFFQLGVNRLGESAKGQKAE